MRHQREDDNYIYMSLFSQADTAGISGVDARRLRVWHQRKHFTIQYEPDGRGDARLYTCGEVLGLLIMRDLVDSGVDVGIAGALGKLGGVIMFQGNHTGWIAARFDDKDTATLFADEATLESIQLELGTNAFATVNLAKYEDQKQTIATLARGLALMQSMKETQ